MRQSGDCGILSANCMIEKSKIANVLGRLREVEAAMGDPAVIADAKRYRAVVSEHAALRKLEAAATQIDAATSAALPILRARIRADFNDLNDM